MASLQIQKQNDYRIAIHEAGHAVVGHLVGVAIDHVALCPDGGGVSSPVRDPAAAALVPTHTEK